MATRLALTTTVVTAVLVCVFAAAAVLLARDYYVDCNNGSDDNSGLSWEEAWETMEYTAEAVESTEADPAMINVAPGEYGDVYWDPYMGNMYGYLSLPPWTSIRGSVRCANLNYIIGMDPTGTTIALSDIGLVDVWIHGDISRDINIDLDNCRFFYYGLSVELGVLNGDEPCAPPALVLSVTDCRFGLVAGAHIGVDVSGLRTEINVCNTWFDWPDNRRGHSPCLRIRQSDGQGLGSSCEARLSNCVGTFWPGGDFVFSPTDFLSIEGDGGTHCDVAISNCLVFNSRTEIDRLIKAKLSGEAECTVNVQSSSSVVPIVVDSDIQDEAQLTIVCSDSILIASSPSVISGTPPAISSHHTCANWNVEGPGNIETNPLFATGALGEHYLSHVDSGQATTSLCVDAGSILASESTVAGLTTRTDHQPDTGVLDMGLHYGRKIGRDPYVEFPPLIRFVTAGEDLALEVILSSHGVMMLADIYLAAAYGDQLFYLSDDGWTQTPSPWMRTAPIVGQFGGDYTVSLHVPENIPTGTYTIYMALIDHYAGDLVSLASTQVVVVPD